MTPKETGVYAITSPSGRQYIGSAVWIHKRWREHRCHLRAGTHHCKPLQRAYVKYGEAALRFEVLEITTRGTLLTREQYHMDLRRKLYNILPQAGGMQGRRVSRAMRERIAAKLRGRQFSPATLERMRVARLGIKQSPELIAKRAAAMRGHVCSTEARAKISASQIGRARPNQISRTGFVGVKPAHGGYRAQFGRTYLGHHLTVEAAVEAIEAFKSSGQANPLRTNNTSGFKGVVAKGSRWQATIRVDGRRIYIGSFGSPEAANAAIQAFKARQ